jgi:hypothetical protein
MKTLLILAVMTISAHADSYLIKLYLPGFNGIEYSNKGVIQTWTTKELPLQSQGSIVFTTNDGKTHIVQGTVVVDEIN